VVVVGARGRLRRGPHRHRLVGAGAGTRNLGDARARSADRGRGAGPLARRRSSFPRHRWGKDERRRKRVAGRGAGGAGDRAGALDSLCRQRPLGAARRRLQQRPRPPPRLGRVAPQRLRPRPRPRVPARPPRSRRSDRRRSGHRPRPSLPRRDHRDRGNDRSHGSRSTPSHDPGPPHLRRRAGRTSLPRGLLLRASGFQGDGGGTAGFGVRDLADAVRDLAVELA